MLRYEHRTDPSTYRAFLSLLHPRLLTSLVLIEPVMEKDIHAAHGASFVKISLPRKNTWSSRDEAEKYFKNLNRKWDPRAHDLWMKYGLRDICHGGDTSEAARESSPAALKPRVTLTTPPEQEVLLYLRPNFDGKKPASGDVSHPDIIGPPHAIHPFYRYEPVLAWRLLKNIRPSVLYLFGEKSPFSSPQSKGEKLERTGRGIGGSGGHEKGKVKAVTVPGSGHILPLENVPRVSDEITWWLKTEIERWKEEEKAISNGHSGGEMTSLLENWGPRLDESLPIAKAGRRSKL